MTQETSSTRFATRTLTVDLPKPRTLELAGSLPPEPRLAIVGSRAARRRFAELVPAAVAVAGERGWSVISGGALGIDATAHRAALADGVPQLAVLPLGADRPYPPAHHGLFSAIAAAPDSGLLFAGPRGCAANRGRFVSRNAIVVALAQAVLVVQAGQRSGTMVTGTAALRGHVPLAAILGTPGCAALVGRGAQALAGPGSDAATGRDVMARELDAFLERVTHGRSDATSTRAPTTWPLRLRWIRDALARDDHTCVVLDALDDPLTGLADLLEAEALGLVVCVGEGVYRGC